MVGKVPFEVCPQREDKALLLAMLMGRGKVGRKDRSWRAGRRFFTLIVR